MSTDRPGAPLTACRTTKELVHTADIARKSRITGIRGMNSAGATRRTIVVPMLKDNELVGAIAIYRQEVRPFTDKQIELVTELRRPGRHRHREHAAAQRTAPAHRRSHRVAGAADGDLGGAESHLQFARANLSRCFRRCWRTPRASASAKFGNLFLVEGDAFRTRRAAWRAAGLCRRSPGANRIIRPTAWERSRSASGRPRQIVHTHRHA